MTFIINDVTPANILSKREAIKRSYNKYGVCIMPGFLSSDKDFLEFKNEIKSLLDQICSRKSSERLPNELGDKLVKFLKICPEDGRIVTDLGT